MADFRLTGEIVIANLDTTLVERQLRSRLGTLSIPVNLTVNARAITQVQGLTTSVNSLSTAMSTLTNRTTSATASLTNFGNALSGIGNRLSAVSSGVTNTNNAVKASTKNLQHASTAAEAFGKSAAIALRRYAAFFIGSKVIFKFAASIGTAVKEAIEFERQMIKVSQVTGTFMGNLGGLQKRITELSVKYGAGNKELVTTSRVLAQAGITAQDTEKALDTLAKTTLAATFTDINKTTEGSIAIMNQFKIGVNGLEEALGAVNKVSGKFAVESDDIITAVRKAGAVFSQAARRGQSAQESFKQFIATFTAIRSTTRESAESIATGLRTITTRIQRFRTIKFLQGFGIDLTDAEGRFVGIYQALDKLNVGLSGLIKSGNDLRAVQIAQEIAGYRQIGKVLPLLTEAKVRQDAYNVAVSGSKSLQEDAAKALQGVGVQLQRVRANFQKLILEIVNTNAFKTLVSTMTSFAHSLITVVRELKPLIPLFTLMATIRLGQFAVGFGKSFVHHLPGTRGLSKGGPVSGPSGKDNAGVYRLEDEEFVLRSYAAKRIGYNTLQQMNRTGKVPPSLPGLTGGGSPEDAWFEAKLANGRSVRGNSGQGLSNSWNEELRREERARIQAEKNVARIAKKRAKISRRAAAQQAIRLQKDIAALKRDMVSVRLGPTGNGTTSATQGALLSADMAMARQRAGGGRRGSVTQRMGARQIRGARLNAAIGGITPQTPYERIQGISRNYQTPIPQTNYTAQYASPKQYAHGKLGGFVGGVERRQEFSGRRSLFNRTSLRARGIFQDVRGAMPRIGRPSFLPPGGGVPPGGGGPPGGPAASTTAARTAMGGRFGGGNAALMAIMGAGMLSANMDRSTPGKAAVASALSGAAGGAALGFYAGSTIPVPGAGVAGMAAGAVIGGVSSARTAYIDKVSEDSAKQLDKSLEELSKSFRLLNGEVRGAFDIYSAMASVNSSAADSYNAKLSQVQGESFILDMVAMGRKKFGGITGPASIISGIKGRSTVDSQTASIEAAAQARTGTVRTMARYIPTLGAVDLLKYVLGESDQSYDKDYAKNLRNVRTEVAQSVKTSNSPAYQELEKQFIKQTELSGSGAISRMLGLSGNKAGNREQRIIAAKEFGGTQQTLDLSRQIALRKEAKEAGNTKGVTAANKAIDSLTTQVLQSTEALTKYDSIIRKNTINQALAISTQQIKFFNAEVKKAGDRATYIATTATDQSRASTEFRLGRAGGNFGSFGRLSDKSGVLNNLNAAPMRDINSVLSTLPISDSIKQGVVANKVLGDRLPDIIANAVNEGSKEGNEGNAVGIAMESIDRLLGSNTLNGEISKQLENNLSKLFNKTGDQGGSVDLADINTTVADIQKPLDGMLKAAQASQAAMFKIRDEFLKGLEAVSQLESRALSGYAGDDRRFASLANRRIQTFGSGDPLTQRQIAQPFMSEMSRLSTGTAFGGALPSAEAAYGRFKDLSNYQGVLRGQLDSGKLNTAQTAFAGGALKANTTEQQNLINYLKLMSQDTSRLVGIEQQQLTIQNKRQAGRNTALGLLGASPQELAKKQRGVIEVLRYQATGQLGTSLASQRNLASGMQTIAPHQTVAQRDALEASVTGSLVGRAGGDFALGATRRGTSGQERTLNQDMGVVIESMKKAAEMLRKIQSQELYIAAQNVYLQYGKSSDAMNTELPQYGNNNMPTQFAMNATIEVNINGNEAFAKMIPQMQDIAANAVTQTLSQHFDLNTMEPKSGPRTGGVSYGRNATGAPRV